MLKTSQASETLCQSGIRAASTECEKIGGINLGQGICDLPTPEIIKQAAVRAIEHEKMCILLVKGYSIYAKLLPIKCKRLIKSRFMLKQKFW